MKQYHVESHLPLLLTCFHTQKLTSLQYQFQVSESAKLLLNAKSLFLTHILSDFIPRSMVNPKTYTLWVNLLGLKFLHHKTEML